MTGNPETQENRRFPASGTPGTRGTPDFDNAGRNERPAPEAADLTAACEARSDTLAGAFDAPDVLADRAAVAAEAPGTVAPPGIPPADAMVEALAEAMAANPAHRITNRETAMAYFRGMARNRLAMANDPMRRGLLLGTMKGGGHDQRR